MSLDVAFHAVLACPSCKGPLTSTRSTEELHCVTCQRAYPIREDVPQLLPEEARPLEPPGS